MEILNLHNMQREEGIGSPLSVALGNFDGVHKGHTELILKAVKIAKERGISSAVWTFADGTAVLPNKPDTKCITTLNERLALISSLGVDYAILESFDDVRSYTPERFVSELLKEKCGAACAVCGFNFRFGAGGIGDSDALRRLMLPDECTILPPVYVDGEQVSSTVIRRYIELGDMKKAASLLGRAFFIDFRVKHGNEIGRTIKVPTINQDFPEGHIIPREGIYACKVCWENNSFLGVANIGRRPTVSVDGKVNCETHIIDFDGILYDKKIKVEFHHRIRDEKKFDDIAGLKRQIEKDKASVLEYFRENSKG